MPFEKTILEHRAGAERRAERTLRPSMSRDIPYAITAAVLITILCWASAFAGIRAGLRGYTPFHLAELRYLVASCCLGGYALAKRMPLPRVRDLPGIVLTGIVGIGLYNLALNVGEISVPAGVASFLVNTGPIFTTVLALLFLHERLRLWGWIGIGVSFVGAAATALGTGDGVRFEVRALIVLVAALAQSIYFVSQKPYLKRYSAVQFTTYAIWAGTIFLLCFSAGLIGEVQVAPLNATLAVVYLGVCPGAIAYVSWAYVLARIPAARATSFLYLVPALAIGIAWIWLGEFPAPVALFGGLLVILGVILVNTRRKQVAEPDKERPT